MINDYFFCVKGYRDLVQFLCSSMKNNLCLCTQNKNLMAYTITITSNSPQALAFVKEAEKLDFAIVTKTKETRPKEKAPAKAKVKAGLVEPKHTVLSKKEEAFKKKFFKALQEAEDIRAGKIKAGNLDDLLNEL